MVHAYWSYEYQVVTGGNNKFKKLCRVVDIGIDITMF